MKILIGFLVVLMFVISGCGSTQLLSDNALERMSPERRVQYRDGLDIAIVSLGMAAEAYDNKYDRMGEPKELEPVEEPEVPVEPVEPEEVPETPEEPETEE